MARKGNGRRRRKPAVLYAVKPGAPFSKEQAQVAGEEFAEMDAAGIERSPRNILERAKDPKSRLHEAGIFDWNVERAAERQWLQVARKLSDSIVTINIKTSQPVRTSYSIEMETETAEGKAERVRAWVPTERILDDEDASMSLSHDHYKRLLQIVNSVEALGLDARFAYWKPIVATIRRHQPPGYGLAEAG